MNLLYTFAILFLCQIAIIRGQNCMLKYGPYGTIADSMSNFNRKQTCWNIQVPLNSFVHMSFATFDFGTRGCSNLYVKISVAETGKEYKFCGSDINRNTVTAFNNVTVTFYFDNWGYYYTSPRYDVTVGYYLTNSFELQYEIQDIICAQNDSFRCTRYSCIPRSQVCDGVKHCENGEDEIGCETGILAIGGVADALESAVLWLKDQRTAAWGWKENTPRAVVALFLASAVNFNGTNLEEELMVKQTELKTSVALLRSSITNNELSMFVNSLLVTCHNPRHFYGNNLVKRLKNQVEMTENFTNPAAYLALCNANETWPSKAMDDLYSVLNTNSDYPFVRDIQAMAVMALSCNDNHSENQNESSTIVHYQDTINRFKMLQNQDGSFGNVYSTALITQALIASDQGDSSDWNLDAAIKYLMKELNSTSVDFLSTYLTLPILNGKSLVDISKIDCSANPRKEGDDIVSKINDYLGPKMRVQYSLYVGDEKDVIHTILLMVPKNFSAYEVMELAEVEDSKYKFERKYLSGKMYVYEIAKVTNDPEVGKFWLQYVGKINKKEELTHSTISPDELILEDGDHLIMWYKTAQI